MKSPFVKKIIDNERWSAEIFDPIGKHNLALEHNDSIDRIIVEVMELEAQLDKSMRAAELHAEASRVAHTRYFELSSKYTEAVKHIAKLKSQVNSAKDLVKRVLDNQSKNMQTIFEQIDRICQLEEALKDIAAYTTILETPPAVTEIINGVLNKELTYEREK